ncbi:hypothetical protein [Roseinatronobacter alkalisoli]|uniref:Uncharacterized protein n=1 Tax=Roseinatronobacter alkalisoli TaxID=3028235 RepID=A0ABT5TAG9_9RHOB|nr:hypothetical protein [Roseinatronobacter sp. HJB301]MDD7971961.1 hypothetical protein [Roseinatronobacter sp. HJB301]
MARVRDDPDAKISLAATIKESFVVDAHSIPHNRYAQLRAMLFFLS